MDPLRNTIQSMYNHNKLCWDAIDEMGGDTSAPHNLQNLAPAIRSIPTGPGVPKSLEELKQMVNRGREIVIGTEIPDIYGGHSNPLIVAQNLNSSNNSDYSGAEGVILVRKYAEALGTKFTTIYDFLANEYLHNCSAELQALISTIDIPYYDGSTVNLMPYKWFLMSNKEIGSSLVSWKEGFTWDYWKTYSNRVVKGTDGNAQGWWLRSRYNASSVTVISASGSDYYSTPTATTYAVYPACFIAKDKKLNKTTQRKE